MFPIERLEQYLKKHGKSYAEVEKLAGLTKNYLSKQISIKSSVGANILEKICNILPGLNPAWLLTGKGDPDLNEQSRQPESAGLTGEDTNSPMPYLYMEHFKLIEGMEISDADKIKLLKPLFERMMLDVKELQKRNQLLSRRIELPGKLIIGIIITVISAA